MHRGGSRCPGRASTCPAARTLGRIAPRPGARRGRPVHPPEEAVAIDVAQPVLVATGVFLLYVALVATLWRVNRVDYLRLAESDRTVVRGIVLPIGAGLVLLALVTTVLGWWPDMLDRAPSGPAWILVVPALVAAVVVVGLFGVDFRGLGTRRTVVLGLGTLVVGCAEELLARGLLVVAPERAGWSLLGVWVFSTVLFALLHAVNGFFGLPWPGTAAQLVLSFVGGTAFFVTLVGTGSLLAAAVLHAAWDFVVLAGQATGRPPSRVVAVGGFVVYLAALVAVVALVA